MSYDIQKTLQLEIENYLKACDLLETLKIFRKEYGGKLRNINNESSFKCKKSSLAKRYFENESEINKTRQKTDHARNKLEASMRKLAQLNAKLVRLEKMCSKHILFNLELVNSIEAKVRNTNFQDAEEVTVNNDKVKVLDVRNLFENLAGKVFSIYCTDENVSRVDEQKRVESPNPLTFNKTVDYQNPDRPNTSDNTCIFSDFNIIPDNELKHISPLISLTSLSSCKFSDFNLIPMHNNNNNKENGAISNYGSNEGTVLTNPSSVSATIIDNCCKQNSSENLNASLTSSCTLESPLLSTSKMHYCRSISDSSCISSYYQNKSESKIKNNRKSGLRSWCKTFLKIPDASKKDSSDTINKAESVNDVKYHDHSLHSSNLSFCEPDDYSDLETSYAETNFSENILDDSTASTTDISSVVSCSSKSVADSVYSCWKQDPELLSQSQFSKQKHGFYRKNIDVNVADQRASHLPILKDKSFVKASNKCVVNDDKSVAKKFFSDAYLLKTGNKMVDKEDYNTLVDSNTPIKNKVKVGKRESCIFNSHQVPNGDLSTAYTIQGRSRLRIPEEKETLFSDEAVRCSKNEALRSLSRSDRSKDRVRKGGELSQVSDRNDLKENSRRSRIVKDSESVNSFKRENSDISHNSENELKLTQNDTHFRYMKSLQRVSRTHILCTEEISDSCGDFSETNSINSLDSHDYFPSEHNLYKTISVENITDTRRGKFHSEKQSINYTFHCIDKGSSLTSVRKLSETRRKVMEGRSSHFNFSTNCAKNETFKEKCVDSRGIYNGINKCIQNTEFCSYCQTMLSAKSRIERRKSPICPECFGKAIKNARVKRCV